MKCVPHGIVSSWSKLCRKLQKTNFYREDTISRAAKQKLHHAKATQSRSCFSHFIQMYTRTSLLLAPLRTLLCKSTSGIEIFLSASLRFFFFLGSQAKNMVKRVHIFLWKEEWTRYFVYTKEFWTSISLTIDNIQFKPFESSKKLEPNYKRLKSPKFLIPLLYYL